MGAFDDLIPNASPQAGAFDDLIPKAQADPFSDLVPKQADSPFADLVPQPSASAGREANEQRIESAMSEDGTIDPRKLFAARSQQEQDTARQQAFKETGLDVLQQVTSPAAISKLGDEYSADPLKKLADTPVMAHAEAAAALLKQFTPLAESPLPGELPRIDLNEPAASLGPLGVLKSLAPSTQKAVQSGLNTALGKAEDMGSGFNIATIGLLPGASPVVQKAVSLAFAGQIGAQIPQKIVAAEQASTPEEKGAAYTDLGLDALMSIGALAHANARISEAPRGSGRANSATQEQIDAAIKAAPQPLPSEHIPDEILDRMVQTHDALTKQNAETPNPTHVKITDSITRELQNVPESRISESRERVAQQPPETPTPAEPAPLTASEISSPDGYAGGPGAMGPVEGDEMTAGQATTSLKRAVIDLQRKVDGREDISVPERASSKELISQAEDSVSKDETLGQATVDRVNSAEVSGQQVSPQDAAVLLVERTRLRNERDAWHERASDPNATESEKEGARQKAEDADSRIDQIDQASRKAGTAWSDFGRLYQQTLRDDFTVDALERKAKAAKGGKLTPEELATVKEDAKTHEEKLTARDEAKTAADDEAAKAETTKAYEQTIQSLRDELSKQPKISKPILDAARGIVERLNTSADAARVRLRERLARTSAGVDPSIVVDVAEIMAAHIGELGLKAAEVSARIVEEFGDSVRPYLESAWEKAKKLIDQEKAHRDAKNAVKNAIPKKEQTEIHFKARAKAEAKSGEPISGKTVADLVRAKVKGGMHGEDEVMAAVHKDIQDAYPDATEKDVRRALVKYGSEVAAPTKDAVETRVRQLKSLVKIEEDIRNLKAGEPTWKSQIRDKRTQELREKVKIRTELLKKVGIPESEQSLAGRDEAKQTALKNAIEDLDKQLRTGEKPVKGEPIPDSHRTEQLRAERDAMREKLKEIQNAERPKPTEQEIAAKKAQEGVDRAAAALDRQQRINSGELKPEPNEKVQPLSSLEKELKAQTEELRKAKREAESKSPTERYNETRMKQVQKQLDEANRRIRESDYAPKPKPTPKEKFAAVAHAEAELTKVKQQIKRNIEQIRFNNRSIPQRTVDAFKNALHLVTAVKILGHGTVGMMTHAGGLAWRPTKAVIYWKNFGRQWGLWLNKSYHEQLIYTLKNDPDFQTWKKAGASIDPEHTYTDYGMYAKWLGKLGEAGGRGFDALKLARLELNKSDWAKVPDSIKNDPEAALETMKRIAEINNKATGAIPKGQAALSQAARNPFADLAFFAPKLYASRWVRVVLDPVKTAGTFFDWNAASEADKYAATKRLKNAAEFTATYAASLLVNQAILSATGSNQNVNFKDPTKADWLKFKAGGKEIMADGGLLDPVRLIGQIVWGDLIRNRTASEQYRQGSRYEKVTNDLGKYVRSKFNPTFGLAVDSATGSDFQGRPLPFSNDPPKFKDNPKYNWGEWLLQQGPIPISGGVKVAYDEMRKKGMSHVQAMDLIKGAAVSVIGTTGVHVTPDHPKK